ncbi:ROK family protein [Lactobacillus sp. ESL0681]|uniref:ROK family protein n=1 Tax=Lactobacillus sp. ESL0681 TaxID=2983211 RepID=UPI0023F8B241|nr:ROK family protein [Lactobacillus sp. ESL0681]WEV40235.1 ROK family protein [Lactobacillus sp. ESL0681]
MKLAVFDIGGTTVKTGTFVDGKLTNLSSFQTPKTLGDLFEQMHRFIDGNDIQGIALSAPGDVDCEKGEIKGFSAVPYLHKRPIFAEIKAEFGLPVAIENDANCAGIGEMKVGSGKNFKNVAFIVIGTGIGGAIFFDGKLYRGTHLTGGEFGFMTTASGKLFAQDGTVVNATKSYQAETGKQIDGKMLFSLANQGDKTAQKLINHVYDVLAEAITNLQVAFDFDAFILGGGVSARADLAIEVSKRVKARLSRFQLNEIMPAIKNCQQHNAANLYGAAYNFLAGNNNA